MGSCRRRSVIGTHKMKFSILNFGIWCLFLIINIESKNLVKRSPQFVNDANTSVGQQIGPNGQSQGNGGGTPNNGNVPNILQQPGNGGGTGNNGNIPNVQQ